MRSLFIPVFVTALCLLHISTPDIFGHHGGSHPAWEVDEFDDAAFMTGLAHPFTGLDHVIVMVAVGLVISMTRRWEIGSVFIGATGLGFASGITPSITLLAMTILIPGALLFCLSRSKNTLLLLPVVAAGFFHGGMHSTVLNGFVAGAGLCTTTAIGVLTGVLVARPLKPLTPMSTRFVRASIVAVGILPAVGNLVSG